jgi:chromosome segregation ATPase
MAVAPSPPPARGPGVEDPRRKLLLDELVAGPEVVLPEPVLHIDTITLDSLPLNRGRRRLEDVEEAAGRNLRAAEEARRALQAEHKRLEAEASIRRKIEREIGSLRRDLERMREGERLRVAQARYGAEREARKEVLAEVEQVREEHTRALQEIERLREALDSDRTLMAEFSDRLRDEQQARAKAQVDADAATDARREAEQRLEVATESGRRRGEEELQRLAAVEAALRDALTERDRLAAEVISLSAEEGRGRDLMQRIADLEHLAAELEAALTAERARTDAAVAHAHELTEELDAARLRHHEAVRSLGVIEQLEAELEGAVVAHGAAIDRVRSLDEQRTRLTERVEELTVAHAQLTAAYEALSAERAAFAEQVKDLQQSLATSSERREDALRHVGELERALSQEQSRVREAEQELRRLRTAASVDARASATGRAEPEAEVAATAAAVAATAAPKQVPARKRTTASKPAAAKPVVAPKAAPEPPPEPDPAPDPEPEPAQPAVARRSALAELAGIASLDGKDTPFRRRR